MIETTLLSDADLEQKIIKELNDIDPNGVVQLKLRDVNSARTYKTVTSEFLRSIVPETINISLSLPGVSRFNKTGK